MTCPNKANAGFRPFSHLQHPREVIRQFTPNWFAATMGTGVLALALAQVPVHIPGLRAFAEGLWLFNIGLFILFSVLYGARWMLYFDEARRIFGHSTVSMFFGTSLWVWRPLFTAFWCSACPAGAAKWCRWPRGWGGVMWPWRWAAEC